MDYGIAIVMLPTVLIGSLVGVMINTSFPDIILQIILTVLLAVLAVQSTMKGVAIFKRESEKHKELEAE